MLTLGRARGLRPLGFLAAGVSLAGCFSSSSGGGQGSPSFDGGEDATFMPDASPDSGTTPQDSASPVDGSQLDSAMMADTSVPLDASDGGLPVLATASVPTDITVDSTSVYWANFAGGIAGAGSLAKVALGGGAVTTLAAGLNGPGWLRHDAANVYWAASDGTAGKVALGGGTPVTLRGTVGSLDAFAFDGSTLYFSDTFAGGWAVTSLPIGGGSVTTLSSATFNDYPGAIAVAGGTVYWAVSANSIIRAVPAAGGTVTTFASSVAPNGITADTANLYWLDGFGVGTVQSMPLAGGAPVTICPSGSGGAYAIAVDATSVYWGTWGGGSGDTVQKAPLGGGSPVTLASGLSYVSAVAVDATSVYWAEKTGNVIRKAPK